ncbi:MAG: type II secretion system F family protein [Ruminococcaceae bacterium]|nr:type II secretion system F family protein [Oscillospiraceae bacterium]
MPAYTYDGLNKQGQNIHGEVVADDSRSAMEKLREAGVIVTTITEKEIKTSRTGLFKKKVNISDLAVFCRQFAAMTSAGVPVTRAMTTLAKQTVNKSLAEAIKVVADDVEGGSTLADAFSQHPKIFNPLFIAMIRSGELGGILEQSLVSLSSQLQKEKKLKDNIKSAVSYPRNIGIFAIILLIGMLIGLVPIFEGMMAGAAITGVTKVIFGLSHSIREGWYYWIAGIIALIVVLRIIIKSKPAHIFWENHKLTMPKLGDFMTKMVVARFCRTLATLLSGGVTAVQALESAGSTAGSDLIDKAVKEAIVDIEDGKSISDSLDKSGLFPPMLIGMIAIGEESGTLPDLLDKVAEFFEEDVEVASQNLKSLIEPIALIGIGGLVGGMLISLYIPMFSAATNMEGY